MSEAIDSGMDGYGTETDIDKAYQEVCEEVGIELSEEIGGPVKVNPTGKKQVVSRSE